MRAPLCAAVAALALSSWGPAATIFVDASRTSGANDGSSWANAFQGRLGLVQALATAQPGDEVWVADGVYAPAPPGGERELSFVMPSGVAVLGGFAGDESSAGQRDPAAHVAVLTGDLNGDDGPPNVGIAPNSGENTRHVVRFEGVAGATLDGVTVRAGLADGSGADINASGGCVRVLGGDALLVDCVIENGRAVWAGAGVGVMDATATLRRCVVRGHRADLFGSGVAVFDNAHATVEDCDFVANYCGTGAGMYVGTIRLFRPEGAPGSATVTGSRFRDAIGILSSPSGGAIYTLGASVVVRDCVFDNNSVVGGGGALYLKGGTVLVDRCDFLRNEAPGDGGGAVFVDGGDEPPGDAVIANSRFVGNNGAILAAFAGHARVVNCTVANNGLDVSFLLWPAFFVAHDSAATIENSVVWNNETGGVFGAPNENLVGTGVYTLANNVVEHWTPAMGPGAVGDDPLFVDPDGADGQPGTADDDLRLLPGSPGRDAGDDAALPIGSVLDLLGRARVIDADADGVATVDLGAFESPCAGDADGDGAVSFADLNAVLSAFGAPPGGASNSGADMNFDGVVNFADLNAVLSMFGADCR